MCDVLDLRATLAFDLHHFLAHRILRHAGGVVQRAEDKVGLAFVVGDDLLLHLLVNGAFLGAHEARAHVDAFRAQRERSHKAARVAEATRGNHRDLDLVGSRRDQDETRNVVLAGMAGAFETIDRDRIDTHAFSRKRVTHSRALMNDLDAVFLKVVHMLLRLIAGRLHDLHAGIDDRLAILGIRRRVERRKNGQVHTEGLVRQLAAFLDLLAKIVRCGLGQRGDEAERAGIGNRSHQFRATDPLHTALHDRRIDAESFRESCLDHLSLPEGMIVLSGRSPRPAFSINDLYQKTARICRWPAIKNPMGSGL